MVNFIRALIATILSVGVISLAPGVVRDSLADQEAKARIAEINHIMYGIFSVNAWKAQISEIVIEEVRGIDLNTTAKKMKTTIENQLNAVIDKLNEQVRESNKHSMGGKIKQALIDLVVNMNDIKKGVPKYADAVIGEMTKPEAQKVVKDMATKQIRKYLAKSFTEQNMEPVERVLELTRTQSIPEATARLHDEMDERRESLDNRSYGMIGLSIALFGFCYFRKNRTKYSVVLMFATLVTLLAVGVSIPMIDLEAKIQELSFVLLGHKVMFENQILYFQSKSVFNVFWLMFNHPDTKMKFVAILIITFSIVFPTLKMLSSLFYYFSPRLRSSKVIQFLAFKIGKWSMADVMVIAIMMAYIGFNGIVEAQFRKMHDVVPKDVTFLTTNGTTLQTGYYIFLTYVLLAMILAMYVKQEGKTRPPVEPLATSNTLN